MKQSAKQSVKNCAHGWIRESSYEEDGNVFNKRFCQDCGAQQLVSMRQTIVDLPVATDRELELLNALDNAKQEFNDLKINRIRNALDGLRGRTVISCSHDEIIHTNNYIVCTSCGLNPNKTHTKLEIESAQKWMNQ